MSIEPIGSAMTYQVQNSNSTPKVKTEKAPVESVDKEVSQSNTERPDNTTVVVKDSQETDGKQKDNSKEEQSPTKQDAVNDLMSEMSKDISENAEAQFAVHEDTNRVMIKIVDKDSKEVLKEFPPEKTLDMIAKVWELAGLFVDEKL